MELDLDKARAARGEGVHPFTFGGVAFDLPAEMSFRAGELFAAEDLRGALTELLNGQAEKFFALNPTVNDLNTLVNGQDIDGEHMPGLMQFYVPGTPPGESSASSPSSPKGSKKPRLPSNATTTST